MGTSSSTERERSAYFSQYPKSENIFCSAKDFGTKKGKEHIYRLEDKLRGLRESEERANDELKMLRKGFAFLQKILAPTLTFISCPPIDIQEFERYLKYAIYTKVFLELLPGHIDEFSRLPENCDVIDVIHNMMLQSPEEFKTVSKKAFDKLQGDCVSMKQSSEEEESERALTQLYSSLFQYWTKQFCEGVSDASVFNGSDRSFTKASAEMICAKLSLDWKTFEDFRKILHTCKVEDDFLVVCQESAHHREDALRRLHYEAEEKNMRFVSLIKEEERQIETVRAWNDIETNEIQNMEVDVAKRGSKLLAELEASFKPTLMTLSVMKTVKEGLYRQLAASLEESRQRNYQQLSTKRDQFFQSKHHEFDQFMKKEMKAIHESFLPVFKELQDKSKEWEDLTSRLIQFKDIVENKRDASAINSDILDPRRFFGYKDWMPSFANLTLSPLVKADRLFTEWFVQFADVQVRTVEVQFEQRYFTEQLHSVETSELHKYTSEVSKSAVMKDVVQVQPRTSSLHARPKVEINTTTLENRTSPNNYITLGIGSDGDGRPQYGKRGELLPQLKYLKIYDDLEEMRTYAEKYNIFWGNMHLLKRASLFESAENSIRHCLVNVKQAKGTFVLYYTGHGDENGDWAFANGMISFDRVCQLIAECRSGSPVTSTASAIQILKTVASPAVAIITDCCNSGKWVEKAKRYGLKSDFFVISACGANETALDHLFGKAFWDGREVKQAVTRRPMISHPTPDTPTGDYAKFEDGNRCWFINRENYDVDWTKIPHNWRPETLQELRG